MKHYNSYFLNNKKIVMDFKFFENDIFFQIFKMNLNKIVWKKIKIKKNIFWRIFQKYSRNVSPKVITKAVQKQAGVACIILFTPLTFNALEAELCHGFITNSLGLH